MLQQLAKTELPGTQTIASLWTLQTMIADIVQQ